MRYALVVTFVLALGTFVYALVGESHAYSRYSEIQSILYDLKKAEQPLSVEMTRRLHTLALSVIAPWEVIRWLSIATAVAAFIALHHATRKKRYDA